MVSAMAVFWLAVLRPDAKRKREAEEKSAADAAQLAELQQKNKELEETINGQRSRPDDFRERLRSKISEFPASPGIAETKPVPAKVEPATPPAEPVPVPSGEDSTVSLQKYADRLFIVKGDVKSGSGFVCSIGGKSVCLTNAHVLSGNKTLTFTRPDGRKLEVAVDQLQVAADRDLAYFPLKAEQPALKPAAAAKIKAGDEIVCLGNTQGQSVITDIRGTILGIGPERIEVDAEVMQGNSGCPVIHAASGEVVGVVTGAFRAPLSEDNQGTRFAEIRRFCLKVDGAQWKPTAWADFAADAAFVESYIQHGNQLALLMVELSAGILNPVSYDKSSVGIRAAVRGYITACSNDRLTPSDRLKAAAAFLRDIGFEIRKGPFEEFPAMRARAAKMCAYHKEVITIQIDGREKLTTVIKGLEGKAIAIAGSQ